MTISTWAVGIKSIMPEKLMVFRATGYMFDQACWVSQRQMESNSVKPFSCICC